MTFLQKVSLCVPCLASVAAAQTNVVTANYDNYRTNANRSETLLKPTTVGAGFGKLGSFPVDGQIYAQPLYVGGVRISRRGRKNCVFAATMNNTVYAIDADAPTAAPPLWRVNLGDPVPFAALSGAMDIDPQVGILSTPVIDIAVQAIYVVSDTFEDGSPVFRLHALSLADGREMLNGPVVIAASAPGTGAGSVNGLINFDASRQLQRPGLALANGNVYVAFGSHADEAPYHGWLIAYNAWNLQQQVAVFNTTPNGGGGGIWQSGHAPAVDDRGDVYVVTGNGDFDGNTNFGGAVIKLAGSNLAVLDWHVPAEWQYQDANDVDLGSTGGILFSFSNLLLAGDKNGDLIYLDTRAMGQVESSPGTNEFIASPAGIFQLSLWESDQGPLLYQHDWNGALKAYAIIGGSVSATPVSKAGRNGDSLYSGMAVSANGGADGILWETTFHYGQPDAGTLHAFNAADLTQELWNSDQRPRDALGAFAKFAVPLVANGRVYVPTFSNQLAIYGLLPSGVATPYCDMRPGAAATAGRLCRL